MVELTAHPSFRKALAMQGMKAGSLAVQRTIILGLLLVLAAAAWALLAWQARRSGADMAMAPPTMGLGAPLFLAIWIVMMVAMMFPAAAPMILTFHAVQAGKRRSGDAFVATSVFIAAYLLVWVISGAVAYAGAAAAEAIAARTGLSSTMAARIGGALLIASGLYQLTALKDRCLMRCRTPIGFVMTSWRDGTTGAIRMGLVHGAYCLGCCWLLFVILFPLGIMNVAAMAIITFAILAEKTSPWGRRTAHAIAAVLLVYGIAVLAVPQLLPTFVADSGMQENMRGTALHPTKGKPLESLLLKFGGPGPQVPQGPVGGVKGGALALVPPGASGSR
ncbi:MAG: DUF2182 domain-containing protein [Acetobacteraceae bacterium]